MRNAGFLVREREGRLDGGTIFGVDTAELVQRTEEDTRIEILDFWRERYEEKEKEMGWQARGYGVQSDECDGRWMERVVRICE